MSRSDGNLPPRPLPSALVRPESAVVSRLTLTEQVESLIRADILSGRLRPGQRLRAVDGAALYGVSATPFREALGRLATDGLVELSAQAGARIAPVSVAELRDIYAVRLTLEPEALKQSIRAGDETWHERLSAAARRFAAVADRFASDGDATGWIEAHDELQEALFAGCESEWLLRFIRLLYAQSQRYRVVALHEKDAGAAPAHSAGWFHEHEEIYNAALRRDTATSVRALRRHLKGTVAAVEGAFTGVVEGADGDGSRPVTLVGGLA